MNSINIHPENLPEIRGEISKSGTACWLKILAGQTDLAIFFGNPIQLAVFCREHNFGIKDNRAQQENAG